jgi:regulator of protease activity HflC (stomatin/prohibitin superfamily)
MQAARLDKPSSCCCCVCIPQSTVGILERMGQFEDVLPPGCSFISPIKDMKGLVSLRVEIMHVNVDCPTKDQTTVRTVTHVMHRVIPSYVHVAYYSLAGAQSQISAYVQSSLRSLVPNYTVDELFFTRSELAEAVKRDLEPQMTRFGREIVDVLIVDIDPNNQIKQSYCMQKANYYARIANTYRTEAEKIEIVKRAEAEAECSRLAGVGLAAQRQAISGSLALNLNAWREAEKGTHLPESEVIAMMMMLQYFDLFQDMMRQASTVKPNLVFLSTTGNSCSNTTGPTPAASEGGLRHRSGRVITDDDI